MLKPLGERIVIKVAEVEEKTAGGLVLPSSAKEKQQFGEVIAIGNDVETEDGVNIGDTVIYKAYSGTEVTDQGQEYLIIDVENVLAVIE